LSTGREDGLSHQHRAAARSAVWNPCCIAPRNS